MHPARWRKVSNRADECRNDRALVSNQDSVHWRGPRSVLLVSLASHLSALACNAWSSEA